MIWRDVLVNQCVLSSLCKMVELILVGEDFFGADHPMHIHGYSFRVVANGKLHRGATVADVIELDQQGRFPWTSEQGSIHG